MCFLVFSTVIVIKVFAAIQELWQTSLSCQLRKRSMLRFRILDVRNFSILSYSVKWNARQEHIVTQRNLLDAWRQVTEILLCCVPLDIFPSAAKQQLLLELLQVRKT